MVDGWWRVAGRVHAVVRLRRPRQLPATRHWYRLIISKVICSLTGGGDCGVKDGTAGNVTPPGVGMTCSSIGMMTCIPAIWMTSPRHGFQPIPGPEESTGL